MTGFGGNQLDGDTDTVTTFAHRPFDDVFGVQIVGKLLNVDRSVFEAIPCVT